MLHVLTGIDSLTEQVLGDIKEALECDEEKLPSLVDPCMRAPSTEVCRKVFKLAIRCCNASRMDKRPSAVSMEGRRGEPITQQL